MENVCLLISPEYLWPTWLALCISYWSSIRCWPFPSLLYRMCTLRRKNHVRAELTRQNAHILKQHCFLYILCSTNQSDCAPIRKANQNSCLCSPVVSALSRRCAPALERDTAVENRVRIDTRWDTPQVRSELGLKGSFSDKPWSISRAYENHFLGEHLHVTTHLTVTDPRRRVSSFRRYGGILTVTSNLGRTGKAGNGRIY